MSAETRRDWLPAVSPWLAWLSAVIPAVAAAVGRRLVTFPIVDDTPAPVIFGVLVACAIGLALAIVPILVRGNSRHTFTTAGCVLGLLLNLAVGGLALLSIVAVSFSGLRH